MNKYLLLGAVVSGLTVGAFARGIIAESTISDIKAEHAKQLKSISDEALKKQKSLQEEMEAKERHWAQVEKTQYEKLRNAEKENASLRADVDADRKRLLIRANCPASSGNMPEAKAGTGVDHGGTAELDPALRQDYYALRDGIERVTRQLKACQERIVFSFGAYVK